MPNQRRATGQRSRRAAGADRRPTSVALAVTQFALAGLAAVVLVGVGGTLVLQRAGIRESVRDARQVTRVLGTSIIQPNLTDGLLTSDRAALEHLDRVVRSRVIKDPVVRVKLWTPEGRIVYSDEPRLIGSTYALRQDEQSALRTERVSADVSDLSRPENRFERSRRKLLEVYLPVRTPSGGPLLFEAYLRFSSVAASGRRIWLAFAPALAAALVLLWLVQLPLALSLARRLRAGQREREALLLRAIEASDGERRRIAAHLHDGVVQDLAGIAFSLGATAGRIESASRSEIAALLRRAAGGTRESMRQLRSLLVEIYPPNLQTAGLEAALSDLLSPVRARGIDAQLDVAASLRLDPAAEELIFRTTQEAVWNVLAHASAKNVKVRVTEHEGQVTLLVEDDGRGFTPEEAERRRAEGHVGLSLLADRAADLGSVLDVQSEPGRGTRVSLEVAEA